MARFSTLVIISVVGFAACSTDGDIEGSISGKWAPYGASELVLGKTMAEWVLEWSRWDYSQTSCDSPSNDIDGSNCGLYQDDSSPVFFLAQAPSKALRTCDVPNGKAVLVPIATFSIDNVGQEPPLPDEQLERDAAEGLASMINLKLIADGKPYTIGEDRAVAPIKHTVMLPSPPNFYSCMGIYDYKNLELNPVFVSGYFALLPAPSAGDHVLSFESSQQIFGAPLSTQVNTKLRVKAAP